MHLVAVVGAGTDHLEEGQLEISLSLTWCCRQLDNLSPFVEKFCMNVECYLPGGSASE